MKSVILPSLPDPTCESTLGYLHRCTLENFYDDPSWLLEPLQLPGGNRDRWMRDIAFGQTEIGSLEDICGAPANSLAELTYIPGAEDSSLCRFGSHLIPVASLAPLRRRACPECAQEGPTRHRLLDLPLYVACHRHGWWLDGDCPNDACGRAIKHSHPFAQTCSVCETSLQWQPTAADADAVALAEEIARLEAGGAPPPGAPYQSLGELLRGLETAALIDMPESMMGRFKLSLHLRSDAELRRIAINAWRWIRNESSFRQHAEDYLAVRRASLPNAPATLWKTHLNRAIDEAKDCRVMQAMSLWLGQLQDVPPAVAACDAIRAELQTFRSAAAVLGVPFAAVRQMTKAGHLGDQPSNGTKIDPEKTTASHAIDDLFRKLRERSDPDFESWQADGIKFTDATQSSTGYNGGRVRLMALFQGMLDGRCRFHLPVGAAIDHILLHREDWGGSHSTEPPKLVPFYEAASILGISKGALNHILATGFLDSTMGEYCWQIHRLVPNSELQRFKREYVVGAEVAKFLGLKASHFTVRVLNAGIVPACGPSAERPTPYVFRKNDMRMDVLNALFKTEFSNQPSKCANADLVALPDAACRLNISEKKLTEMWQRGLISRHIDNSITDGVAYFTAEALEEYEQKFRHNPELLHAAVAAKQLGLRPEHFHRHYVEAGRIALIDDGAGRMYVRKRDLKPLHPSRDPFMTVGQACDELGISTERFNNLARFGRMPHVTTSASGQFLYSKAAIRDFGERMKLAQIR